MRSGSARQSRRTVSGPNGSSTKAFTLGAAGQPDLISKQPFARLTPYVKAVNGYSQPQRPKSGLPPPKQPVARRSILLIHPLLLLSFALLSLLGLVALGIYLITTYSVRIVVEQSVFQVRTYQRTVGDLLGELGVFIAPQDRLSLAPETPLTNGLTLYIDKAESVILEHDGERRRFLTHESQPLAILAEAGVPLGDYDQILVDGAPLAQATYHLTPQHVRVLRARMVQVQDGDQPPQTVYTVAQTIGEALHGARIGLYVADRVSPSVSAPLEANSLITIRRSVAFSILLDGRVLPSRSTGRTVGEALAESGVALIGLDYCLPEESAPLVAGMTIRVVRVTEEDEIDRSEIDFQQVFQPDTGIPPETQKVIQAGVKGVLERRVRVRREDGVEVSRSLPYSVVVRDPRHEVIAVGATPALLTPMPPLIPLSPTAPGS